MHNEQDRLEKLAEELNANFVSRFNHDIWEACQDNPVRHSFIFTAPDYSDMQMYTLLHALWDRALDQNDKIHMLQVLFPPVIASNAEEANRNMFGCSSISPGNNHIAYVSEYTLRLEFWTPPGYTLLGALLPLHMLIPQFRIRYQTSEPFVGQRVTTYDGIEDPVIRYEYA